jgi:Acyl carrier protein
MTRIEIEGTLYRAMEEEFEIEAANLVPEARIKEDLGLDSLDIVDMVVVLESAYGFSIPDKSALLKIETLGDVADFIEKTCAGMREEKEVCALRA